MWYFNLIEAFRLLLLDNVIGRPHQWHFTAGRFLPVQMVFLLFWDKSTRLNVVFLNAWRIRYLIERRRLTTVTLAFLIGEPQVSTSANVCRYILRTLALLLKGASAFSKRHRADSLSPFSNGYGFTTTVIGREIVSSLRNVVLIVRDARSWWFNACWSRRIVIGPSVEWSSFMSLLKMVGVMCFETHKWYIFFSIKSSKKLLAYVDPKAFQWKPSKGAAYLTSCIQSRKTHFQQRPLSAV